MATRMGGSWEVMRRILQLSSLSGFVSTGITHVLSVSFHLRFLTLHAQRFVS